MKLSRREGFLLYILGLIIIIMAGVLLLIKPAIDSNAKLKDELQDKQNASTAELGKENLLAAHISRYKNLLNTKNEVEGYFHKSIIKIGDKEYNIDSGVDMVDVVLGEEYESSFFNALDFLNDQIFHQAGADGFFMDSAQIISLSAPEAYKIDDKAVDKLWTRTVSFTFACDLSDTPAGMPVLVPHDTVGELAKMLEKVRTHKSLNGIFIDTISGVGYEWPTEEEGYPTNPEDLILRGTIKLRFCYLK